MNKEVVWTSYGLDGAGAYLVLCWLLKKEIEVYTTSVKNFRSDFLKWSSTNNTDSYNKIFIVNLDVSNSDDLVDLPNCVIIDSHDSHLDKHNDRRRLYNAAKTVLSDSSTSTTRLIQDTFFKALSLTDLQAKFVSLVDQYILGSTEPTPRLLNIALWSSSSYNRLQEFVARYSNGFDGFDKFQKNAITLYIKQTDELLKQLDLFTTVIPFRGKQHRVISTFATTSYDDVLHKLLSLGADISIVVNLQTKAVYARSSSRCDIPLHKFAAQLCNGSGNKDFAGGQITDKFLEFSKNLQPYAI